MAQHIKMILNNFTSANSSWKHTLLSKWPTIIGNLSDQISIEKIRETDIVLGVNDSCLLQELYLLSPVILSLINKTLDPKQIKQIHFKQIYRKQQKRVTRLPKETDIKSSSAVVLSDREKQALEKISDKTLRSILYKFRFQCQ